MNVHYLLGKEVSFNFEVAVERSNFRLIDSSSFL